MPVENIPNSNDAATAYPNVQPQAAVAPSQQYAQQPYQPQYPQQPAYPPTVHQYAPPQPLPPQPGYSQGVISIILGAVALFVSFTVVLSPLAAALGVAGIILGVLSIKKAKSAGAKATSGKIGLGISIGGIVLATVAIVILALLLRGIHSFAVLELANDRYQNANSNSNNSSMSYNSNGGDGSVTNMAGVNALNTNLEDNIVYVNGYEVHLGKTTIGDLQEHTEWKNASWTERASEIYGSREFILLERENAGTDHSKAPAAELLVEVDVGEEDIGKYDSNIDGFVIFGVLVDAYGQDVSKISDPIAIFPGGVKLGSPYEFARQAYGEPLVENEDSIVESGIWTTADSTSAITVNFDSHGAYVIAYEDLMGDQD